MEAGHGFQQSYSLRSIFCTKEAIQKGGRWQIADGKKVKNCRDNWLSDQTDFKVKSHVRTLGSDAMVESLVDEVTKQWNRDLIFSYFTPMKQKQILNIPLSQRLPEDRCIWHCEKDDEYYVRSAYHTLCEANCRDHASSSNPSPNELWSEIWKARY